MATNGSSRNGGRARANSKNRTDISFHPKLITAQIVALQSFHYFALALFVEINHVLYNTTVTVDRIFTDKYIKLWESKGWPDVASSLLAAIVGGVMLAIIVEKSKKCLDFALTLFFIHLLACVLYRGLPSTWDWWICHILSTILMVVSGEYLCSRKELDDIPLLQL